MASLEDVLRLSRQRSQSLRTSSDYDEEIRRLELEGVRLGAGLGPQSLPASRSSSRPEVPGLSLDTTTPYSSASVTSAGPPTSIRALQTEVDSVKQHMQKQVELLQKFQDQLKVKSYEVNSIKAELRASEAGPDPVATTRASNAASQGSLSELKRLQGEVKKSTEGSSLRTSPVGQSYVQIRSSPSGKDPHIFIPSPRAVRIAVSPSNSEIIDKLMGTRPGQEVRLSGTQTGQDRTGGAMATGGRTSAFDTVGRGAEGGMLLQVEKERATAKSPELHPQSLSTIDSLQVQHLKEQLKQANELTDLQKHHFREAITELQDRLQEALLQRERLLEQRENESRERDQIVSQLQSTLKELESANKQQEKAMIDTNSRVDDLQKNLKTADVALVQIRTFLAQEEDGQGRPFLDGENARETGAALLPQVLQKCLQDRDVHIQTLTAKVTKLEQDVRESQQKLQEEQHRLTRDSQDRLQQVVQEYKQQLDSATERANNSRKQATTLQTQLTLLQEQTQSQVELKDGHIADLEAKYSSLRDEHKDMKQGYEKKVRELERALDTLHSELSNLQLEKEHYQESLEECEQEMAQLKQSLVRGDEDLKIEREQTKRLWSRDEDQSRRVHTLEAELEAASLEVRRLKELVQTVKQECKNQMEKQVLEVKEQEQQRLQEQINVLSAQLETERNQSQKLGREFEWKTDDIKALRQRVEELQHALDDAQKQLGSVVGEKNELSAVAEERLQDMERVRQERAHYIQMLEQRNEEFSSLQSSHDRLQVQLEEREKSLSTLQQQSENVSHMLHQGGQEAATLRVELDRISKALSDKMVETEELRMGYETLTQRLQLREKFLVKVEEEKKQLSQQVSERVREVTEVMREKDRASQELKDSRFQVAYLTDERDSLKALLEGREGETERQIKRLSSKLKAALQELEQTRKALQAKESVDNKAYHVAETIQQEVTDRRSEIDSLKSRLHWLEECLDTAVKEKTTLQTSSEGLNLKLEKSDGQISRLQEELLTVSDREQEARHRVTKLENALEKVEMLSRLAAVKHASQQALIEQQEQELARMKLRHSLELRELQRRAAGVTGVAADTAPDAAVAGVGSLTSAKVSTQGVLHQTIAPKSPPVSQKPSDSYLQSLAANADAGQELRRLLTDMRQLIVDSRPSDKHSRSSDRHSRSPDKHSHHRHSDKKHHKHRTSGKKSPPSSATVSDTEETETDRYSRALNSTTSEDTVRYAGLDRPVSSSSPKKSTKSERQTAKSYQSRRSYDTNRSPSPIESLLLSHPVTRGNQSAITLTTDDLSTVPSTVPKTSRRGTELSRETVELCRRLEDKLQHLSQVGDHLKMENQEMAALIKSHDRQLKRVRQTEKTVQKVWK
ncbi:coiled-coil domain-containing protein 158-like isoform X2 [Branchiostoma floridae]|uniref:Coiled-coil domain-containing protein 158-like isoform X2 n=1 Tax=Branchiostoma floridae TaxID=7739 RepID=A0A9J7LFA4_BRAFL|nr:coiled-coil domain-containing protein 158-like isoform X2 [Branchiostoma floridae]